MTIIQSLNLVYLIFNLLIVSLVIRIAILVNRAVLDGIIVLEPGLIRTFVEVPLADRDPIKISVTFISVFFLFKLIYFLL